LPTLEELQSTNFSDFVRNVVLRKAELGYDDRGEENDHKNLAKKAPIHYLHGMAKVTLPKGFCDHVEIAKDETGRGPGWDEGTKLGDMILPSPIKQCVRGIGGIYEFTFLDQKPITLADFRKKSRRVLEITAWQRNRTLDRTPGAQILEATWPNDAALYVRGGHGGNSVR